MYPHRGRRERGEGSVAFIAALLLITSITVAFVANGTGPFIAKKVLCGVQEVEKAGGMRKTTDCDPHGPVIAGPSASPSPGLTSGPPTASPAPGPTDQPQPSAGPSATPSATPSPSPTSTKPPQQQARPVNTCYTDINVGYTEGTVSIPIRWIDVRAGLRLGFQYRKVVVPGKPPTWQVTVYAWGEGSAATPNVTKSDGGAASKLPLGLEAWFGAAAQGSQTYTVDSEKDAQQFPAKYIQWLARQAGLSAAEANPVTGPAVWVGTHLPFGLGKKVKHAIVGDPPPGTPLSTSVAVGTTAGINGKFSIGGLTLALNNREWQLQGVQHYTSGANAGDTVLTLQNNAETQASAIIDMGSLLDGYAAAHTGLSKGEVVRLVTADLATKYGGAFKFSATAINYLVDHFPDTGIAWKGKINVQYQVTFDSHGHLLKYTRIVDSQGNWSGLLPIEGGPVEGRIGVSLNDLFPGGRIISQSTLPIVNDHVRDAVLAFFGEALVAWNTLPAGAGLAVAPAAQALQRLVDQYGTQTRLHYSSDVNYGQVTVSVPGVKAQVKVEMEADKLTGADIDDGEGWTTWADCHN